MNITFSISLTISRENSDEHILTRKSWRRLRKQIGRRDGYTCQYCGEYCRDGQVDHIVPLSQGGNDEVSNLVWACSRCNGSKRDMSLEQWRQSDRARHIHISPIDEDGNMTEELQAFYQAAQEVGTSIRIWQSEIGRGRYELYRDALIGHGLASWNSYKRDGNPNRNTGWSLESLENHCLQASLPNLDT